MYEAAGEENDEYGTWEGECQICGLMGRVGDLSLCRDCAGKLERDMIRERSWAHSATAYGVPVERREELRQKVVAQYGNAYELIEPGKETKKKNSSRKRKRNKRKSGK